MQAERTSPTVAPKRLRRVIVLALLLTFAAGAVYVLAYNIGTGQRFTRLPWTSIARNIPPVYSYSIFGVEAPAGVAVTPDGSLIYVADHGQQGQVRVFDRSGDLQFSLVPPITGGGSGKPMYIAVGADSQVFVADIGRREISVYSPHGEYLGAIKAPDAEGAFSPIGVTFDLEGNLYASDRASTPLRVVSFNPDFTIRSTYQRPANDVPGAQALGGVAVDGSGRVFASNGLAFTIDVFNADGQLMPSSEVGSFKLGLPHGVAIDRMNRLYVVDSINGEVHVYDLNTTPIRELFKFGRAGNDDESFSFPVGVAVDATGRVYIGDQANGRVQVWSY
ncbi:MAG: hypothetical protein EPO21_13870 [Chloroflexota bacterium]|nr:MAG: hypothetical protein EPO21_13870 [Chloroflexota bacterium]